MLPLSRRINHEDGSFAGIVRATINIARIQSFYASLDVGRDGNVTLWSGNAARVIARNPDAAPKNPNLKTVKGDVTDPASVAQLVRGHDAVISSAPFIPGISAQVLEAVRQSGVKRYIAVGGAGSLLLSGGSRVIDSPGFPEEYKAEASAGSVFLDTLRQEKDLDWTFLSPSAEFVETARTGKFRLGQDELLVSSEGRSWISFADFAIALIDEVETPKHSRQRFTVGY